MTYHPTFPSIDSCVRTALEDLQLATVDDLHKRMPHYPRKDLQRALDEALRQRKVERTGDLYETR